MGIIEQADRIVGIENAVGRLKSSLSDKVADTYRRGAYCEWLAESKRRETNDAKIPLGGLGPLEDIAAEVVRIHAASQPKQPDDGLPPGPWHRSACGTIHDAGGELLWPGRSRAMAEATVDHIVRCGSPAVRRLLAAFEVTEDKQDGSMGLCCSDSGVCFHVWHTEPLRDPSSVICWLTPRSNP